MTETSIMYAGTTTDPRQYLAASIAAFFRTQLQSGVSAGLLNAMAVSPHGAGDYSVDVATGEAWGYGYFCVNDALLNLAVDTNTSGSVRIDRVILRNTIASGISIVILKGTPGAGAPALTQTASVYEISLAYLTLANGYSQILTANITDERTYATLKRVKGSALVCDADIAMGAQKITTVPTPTGLSDTTTLVNKTFCDDSANYADLPPGVVVEFGTTTIPGGFLACDGAAVSRTTYAALFAAIGILHGAGDGSTTFNVPLLTDRIIVGQNTADADFDTVGETGGAATVTLDATMLATHNHGNVPYCTATSAGNAGATGIEKTGDTVTGSYGGGGAHNNLGPYIKLAFGIKV
jgi:microcystin-dependent protein